MTPILDLRIIILDAVCRAQKLPDSAERTTTLDHLRFAARTLLPLVQAEEDECMRAHLAEVSGLRERDTLPAPAPSEPPRHLSCVPPPPIEPSDVASHWSLSNE